MSGRIWRSLGRPQGVVSRFSASSAAGQYRDYFLGVDRRRRARFIAAPRSSATGPNERAGPANIATECAGAVYVDRD